MSSDIQVNIALGMSLATFAGLVGVVIRFGRFLEQHDQLWQLHKDNLRTLVEFQLRRGVLEAQQKGIMKKNSPLRLSEDAIRLLSPLGPELRAYHIEKNWPIGDPKKYVFPTIDQFLDMERQFGPRITELLCDPMDLNDGACLIAAIEFGRQLAAEKEKAA